MSEANIDSRFLHEFNGRAFPSIKGCEEHVFIYFSIDATIRQIRDFAGDVATIVYEEDGIFRDYKSIEKRDFIFVNFDVKADQQSQKIFLQEARRNPLVLGVEAWKDHDVFILHQKEGFICPSVKDRTDNVRLGIKGPFMSKEPLRPSRHLTT